MRVNSRFNRIIVQLLWESEIIILMSMCWVNLWWKCVWGLSSACWDLNWGSVLSRLCSGWYTLSLRGRLFLRLCSFCGISWHGGRVPVQRSNWMRLIVGLCRTYKLWKTRIALRSTVRTRRKTLHSFRKKKSNASKLLHALWPTHWKVQCNSFIIT